MIFCGSQIDEYADKIFYKPMGLTPIGFNPRKQFDANLIAPTEMDTYFRHHLLHGDIRDEGSVRL